MQPDYPHSHSQEHRLSHIFEPTASSVGVGFFGTILLIVYGGRTLFNGDEFWFLAFFGRELPLDQSYAVQDQLFGIFSIFQNTTFNGVLLFIFWLFLGIIAYELIQTVLYFYFEIQEDKHLIMYDKPGEQHHVPSLIKTTLKRVAFRTAGMIAMLVYFIIVTTTLWPTIVSVFIGRLTDIQSPLDILLGLLAFLNGMILFHGFTILLRALTLKLRLFHH